MKFYDIEISRNIQVFLFKSAPQLKKERKTFSKCTQKGIIVMYTII